MSSDSLGNKQSIILHKCIINDERYDRVTTPHRQTIGYIRTKRQTLKKKVISKQKQIIRKRFLKRRNAVSESSAIQELRNLKDSIKNNHQIDDQLYFLGSETTSPTSITRKCKTKKSLQRNQYSCTIGINQKDTLKITR